MEFQQSAGALENGPGHSCDISGSNMHTIYVYITESGGDLYMYISTVV